MTCKGMLFIEFHQFEGTSHGHNFHVFLRKTQHYVLWAQKGAWQRKQETGIKFYGFILLSNWWEGSRDDLPPTPKLFPYYNLPQHINRLETEMLSCCPLLSSTVDLWRCQGEYCAHTFVLMGTHRCFAKSGCSGSAHTALVADSCSCCSSVLFRGPAQELECGYWAINVGSQKFRG